MKFCCIYTLLFFACSVNYAQTIFSNFTTAQFGDSIYLNWTLNEGAACVNMDLQRADESLEFETLYSVSGICGGTEEVHYSFIDYAGLQSSSIYYYRIYASAGSYISDTITINYISTGLLDILIYPDPVSDFLNISVNNRFISPFTIQILTPDGRLIQTAPENSNMFGIQLSGFSAGYYIVFIYTREGVILTERFIIQ